MEARSSPIKDTHYCCSIIRRNKDSGGLRDLSKSTELARGVALTQAAGHYKATTLKDTPTHHSLKKLSWGSKFPRCFIQRWQNLEPRTSEGWQSWVAGVSQGPKRRQYQEVLHLNEPCLKTWRQGSSLSLPPASCVALGGYLPSLGLVFLTCTIRSRTNAYMMLTL